MTRGSLILVNGKPWRSYGRNERMSGDGGNHFKTFTGIVYNAYRCTRIIKYIVTRREHRGINPLSESSQMSTGLVFVSRAGPGALDPSPPCTRSTASRPSPSLLQTRTPVKGSARSPARNPRARSLFNILYTLHAFIRYSRARAHACVRVHRV